MLRLSIFVFGMLVLSELLRAATPEQVDPIYIYSVDPNSSQPSNGSTCEGSAQVYMTYWNMNADLSLVSADGPTPCDSNYTWSYTVTNHVWDYSETYTKQSVPRGYCPKGYTQQNTGTFTSTCIKNTIYDDQCDGSIMCCSTRTDNPLDVVTGNKYYEVEEYASEGVVPLIMKRYYNSTISEYWGYDFTQRLNILDTDSFGQVVAAEAVRPNGNVYQYVSYMLPDGDIGHTTVWRALSPQQDRLMKLTPLFESGGDLLPPVLQGWVLEIQGVKEHYHADGQLDSIEYEDGNSVFVQNSHSSIFVSNLHGQSITLLKPNIPGLPYQPPSELVTPLGSITYHYRADNPHVLERTEYPDGTSEVYHFEEGAYDGLITGVTDRRGIRNSFVEYAYASKGKADSSSLAGDVEKVTALSMSSASTIPYQRVVRNSRGNDTIMSFDKIDGVAVLSSINDCRGCGFGDASFDYELAGELDSVTIDGVITDYEGYDDRGNPAQIIEASGTSDQRVTDLSYDDRFFSEINTLSIKSLHGGSAAEKVTTILRNDSADITSIGITGFDIDGMPLSRVTTLKHDGPLGQLSEIDGPLDTPDKIDVTGFEYYPNTPIEGHERGRLKRIIAPEGIVVIDDLRYSPTGKRTYYKTANDLQVTLEYYPGNDRLELMTEYDPDTDETRMTHWTYVNTGEVETITTGYGSSASTSITFEYDDARRLERIFDGLGNYIQYQLDTEGNPESESVYDSVGTLSKHLNRIFDAYDQLDIANQVNESRDAYVKPNGDIEEMVDASGTMRFGYDDLRRMTSITHDVGGSDPSTADALTQIRYDHHDNIREVIDPENANTRYKYDDLGNTRVIASPDTGATYIEYDPAGIIEYLLDAKQQEFHYRTDALGRLENLDMPGDQHDVSYDYDSCQNGIGRLCGISNASAVIDYAYDAWGNVLQHQSIVYEWDESGRLKSIAYPSGAVVTHHYDDAGRIDKLVLTKDGVVTELASDIEYEPFGPMKELLYGNGIQLSHQRDLAWRSEIVEASSAISLDYQQYDGNGNLEVRADNLTAVSEIYSYDPLNRVDTASGAFGVLDYGYDLNGNRTIFDDGDVIDYLYSPFSNRMESVDGESIQLDANGNTESRGQQVLSYTPHNRLYQVHEQGVLIATYRYNGLGQRVSKMLAESGFETRYIYGLQGQLLAEMDTGGAVLKEYVYLNGVPIAVLDRDHDGDGIPNSEDNCVDHPNGPLSPDAGGNIQSDTDGDGFGNRCDADYDNNGLVSGLDLGHFKQSYGTPDPDADHDGSGLVGGLDLAYFKLLYGRPPGPARSSAGGSVRYIHSDHLGTPKSMTDDAGNVIWKAVHAPFGHATLNQDPDIDGKRVTLNVRYPGQYFDSETGLHYNYFRYYDPDNGRYLTSDPIGLAGGLNSYRYADSDPISNYDSYGLLAINFISGGVGAGIELYNNFEKYSGRELNQRVALGFITGFFVPGKTGLTVGGGLTLGVLNAGADAINQVTDSCGTGEIDLNKVGVNFILNQTGLLGQVFGRKYTGQYLIDQILGAGLSKTLSDEIVRYTPSGPKL